MDWNMKNNTGGPNGVVSQLAGNKKKSVMAFCLVAVMVFMWVRVLRDKQPESAEAAMRREQTANEKSNSQSMPKMSFVELPKVEGRNDALSRDFFAVDDWQDFLAEGQAGALAGIEEVNVMSGDELEKSMGRVAKKLKLEAIELGPNPRAFINDKLLGVGDKLAVRDGGDTYECEVIGIEENTVFMRCEEVEITLKLMKVIETAD